MVATPTPRAAVDATTALQVARLTASLGVIVAASILVNSLVVYARDVLVSPYKDRRWYLVGGAIAALVYGIAGVLLITTSIRAAVPFRTGATLFFFLFSAAGVRALYATVKLDRGGFDPPAAPEWTWYVIIGLAIVAWWGAYLFAGEFAVRLVEVVGLAGAITYTVVFAVLTVRDAEGTAVASIIRQFTPALLWFAAVVALEQVGRYLLSPGVVVGLEVVGTTLVGAFLFTTGVAIRQESGKVHRLYDRTTWRRDEESGVQE